MSDSDGHSYITFGWVATIIGVLLFFAVLNSKYAETQQSSEYADKCAEQYKSFSAKTADIAPLASDKEEPIRAQKDKYNPDWCDLAAQQSMAESTYWMNVAAIATVIFTAWGAFLLWRTLIATQETVAITRRIGEAQTRAYMTTSGAEAVYRDGQLHVTVHAQNTGQSPALAVRTQTFIAIEPDPFDPVWLEDKLDVEMKSDVGAGQHIFLQAEGPEQPDNYLIASITLNSWKVWVYATILYDDVFERPHTTRCCYEMEYKSGANKYAGKIMPIGNSMD